MFKIVNFPNNSEGQCLNKNRMTTPLYILLAYNHRKISTSCHLCHAQPLAYLFKKNIFKKSKVQLFALILFNS